VLRRYLQAVVVGTAATGHRAVAAAAAAAAGARAATAAVRGKRDATDLARVC
jgi:hypothetical protein